MAEKATIEGELCVKEVLKARGIKMKDLAEQINIAPETLTRTLRGNPQYSTLKSIADRSTYDSSFGGRRRKCCGYQQRDERLYFLWRRDVHFQ